MCIKEQGFSIAFPNETRDLCVMPAELAPDHLDLSKPVVQPPGSCKHGSEAVALNGTWQKLEDGVTCLCVDEDFEICDDGMLLPDDDEDKDEDEMFELVLAEAGKHGEIDSFSDNGGGMANPGTPEGKESGQFTDPIKESSAAGQAIQVDATDVPGHNQDLNGDAAEVQPSDLDSPLPNADDQASDSGPPLGAAGNPATADYKSDGARDAAYPPVPFVDIGRTSVIGPGNAGEGKGGDVMEPQEDAMPGAPKQPLEEHGVEAIKDEHEEIPAGEQGENDNSGGQNMPGEEDDLSVPSDTEAKAGADTDETNESWLQDMMGDMGVAEAVQGDEDFSPLAPAASDDNSSGGNEYIGTSHSSTATTTDESLDEDAGRNVDEDEGGGIKQEEDMIDSDEDSRAVIVKPAAAAWMIIVMLAMIITTLLSG